MMKCGTAEMYRKHLRDGTPVDDACRGAQAQAIAEYRAARPPRDRSAETRAATIRRRALNRLAEENPDRLAALIAEETSRATGWTAARRDLERGDLAYGVQAAADQGRSEAL